MQPTWGKEAEQYREKVQGFLAEHIPADNHLLAPRWPAENGGPGLTEPETVVLAEEFATAGVPTGGPNDVFGIQMVGNTLQGGTEDQKREFIPKILSGEHRWCQGYSEPDAGSDLGDLDGEEWVINGQKIWTSAGEMVLGLSEEPGPEGAGASWKALQQRS